MVPGIEIVDLHQPAVGLMSNFLNVLPDYKRGLHLAELEAAEAAGVDASRDLPPPITATCAHMSATGRSASSTFSTSSASMGLHTRTTSNGKDHAGRRCDRGRLSEMIATHHIDPGLARDVVVKVMLTGNPCLFDDKGVC